MTQEKISGREMSLDVDRRQAEKGKIEYSMKGIPQDGCCEGNERRPTVNRQSGGRNTNAKCLSPDFVIFQNVRTVHLQHPPIGTKSNFKQKIQHCLINADR